eukprot:6156172-Amphidinium_carterae.1
MEHFYSLHFSRAALLFAYVSSSSESVLHWPKLLPSAKQQCKLNIRDAGRPIGCQAALLPDFKHLPPL